MSNNDSDMNDFKMARAHSHYSAGRHQQAIDTLKELLGQSPDDADAHALLALNLLECGRITAAEFEITLSLKKNPNEPYFHWVLGRIYILKNKPKQSLMSAEECLRLDPDYYIAHLLKYTAFQLLDRLDDALQAVDDAAKIEPNSSDVKMAYIRCHIAKNERLKAEKLCQERLEEDAGNNDANVIMGEIKLALGDVDDAEYHAKYVIFNNPNSTEALELLANIKLRKSKLMGLWWWTNSKLAHMNQLKSTSILIAAFVLFTALAQIVKDLGYIPLSQVIGYAWLGIAAYSWIGIPAYYRALKKELSQFEFNKDF